MDHAFQIKKTCNISKQIEYKNLRWIMFEAGEAPPHNLELTSSPFKGEKCQRNTKSSSLLYSKWKLRQSFNEIFKKFPEILLEPICFHV